MAKLTREEMWEQMLTGSYPRLQILVSAEAAEAGGLETTGLEQRTLELRGKDQAVDAWVATAVPQAA